MAVDPIEKKPLFHFLPGTRILSFGTYGCNFSCQFCQNWEMSQYPRLIKAEFGDKEQVAGGKSDVIRKLKRVIDKIETWTPEKIVEYALGHHIPSIAYTYNEPAIFFEYAYDTARLAHKNGIKNIFVSNGYESKEALQRIHPYLDAINIDLKSMSEKFYMTVCRAKLKPVMENIRRCFEMGIWIEVTTLIIPTLNDDEGELKEAAEFLVSISDTIPWHLSAYHPDYEIRDIRPTPVETLLKGYKIGKQAGLKYVYVGNISDTSHETTICPKCGEDLVCRNWHETEILKFKNGKCGKCNLGIEGVWR